MIAVSSNLTATYNDKGFHLIALRLDQNRKAFRTIVCALERTIANKHERWILRRIFEIVKISDSFCRHWAWPQTERTGEKYLTYQALLGATDQSFLVTLCNVFRR